VYPTFACKLVIILKTFQKIVSLCMTILLTALSANATSIGTTGSLDTTSTPQNLVDAISLGKTAAYLIDSPQQELIVEKEQESLPLVWDDGPFFTGLFNKSGLLSVLEHCTITATENASVHKYYTKRLLFPFHSHW